QGLYQRRKPQRVGRKVVGGSDQGDRMRDGKRSHDQHELTDSTKRNDQTEEKQQMIDAVQDVQESQLHELQRRLMPSRIEPHQSGITTEFEGANRIVGRHESKHRQGTKSEAREL